MKHVVYLLGAGFSAPLGLPVMANFLEKAKDLFYESDGKYEHFGDVLTTINRLHVANTYYNTDVFNIEDILSILDMQGRLSGTDQGEKFTRFLSDVITYYTPRLQRLKETPSRWSDLLFWPRPWEHYGPFVSSLLGYEFVRADDFKDSSITAASYACRLASKRTVRYSVVTLNYDLVLEQSAKSINTRYKTDFSFTRVPGDNGVPLAKLHGSIDTKDIVPPTWSKSLAPASIRAAWGHAYNLLKSANDLRIIGYSLPESDAYIRYLLRAAVIDTPNLKRIHVLCRDDGTLEKRYTSFVNFRNWQFKATDTESYLAQLASMHEQWPRQINPDRLEDAHQYIFGSS